MFGRLFSSCVPKAGWLVLGCIPLLLRLLDELLALCDKLPGSRSETEQLKADLEKARQRIKELEERLNQNSSNTSRPPSSDDPRARSKRSRKARRKGRKPGGQPGHRGWWRRLLPPQFVDSVEPVIPEVCSHCGAGLPRENARKRVRRWQQHEWMGPRTGIRVTEFRCYTVRCSSCGKKTVGELPAECRLAIGPRLQAVIVVLTVTQRLTRRQVCTLLNLLLGVRISVGTLQDLCMRASRALEDPYQHLEEEIRRTYAANMDETSWKLALKRLWLWVARSDEVTLFRIAESRGGEVIRDILGEDFDGTVMCDRWSAYQILGKLAYCWAHLKRDFQAMVDRGGGAQEIGASLLELTEMLFKAWHRFKNGELTRAELLEETAELREAFRAKFEQATESDDKKARGLAKNLLKNWAHVFRFLDEEGIEPTNNAAERALRALVILRKLCYGNRSDDGCRFIERAFSVLQTLLDQDVDVVEWLSEAFLRDRRGESVPDIRRARSQDEGSVQSDRSVESGQDCEFADGQRRGTDSRPTQNGERPLDWSRHSVDLPAVEWLAGTTATECSTPQGGLSEDELAAPLESSVLDSRAVEGEDVLAASHDGAEYDHSACCSAQSEQMNSAEPAARAFERVGGCNASTTFEDDSDGGARSLPVLRVGYGPLGEYAGVSSCSMEGAREGLAVSSVIGSPHDAEECVGTIPAPG